MRHDKGAKAVRDVDWRALDKAIDELERGGRQARFWWRDDDAVEDTAELRRLVDRARHFGAPVLLAVVPAQARANLVPLLGAGVTAAVHGFAHINHAGPGEKKQELGSHRGVQAALDELSSGRDRLLDLFGERLAPVLVPPWNRIAPEIAARLPDIGFRGMSTFGPEDRIEPVTGLTVVNTHLDPIDWHGSRSLGDTGLLIDLAVRHVRQCAAGGKTAALGLLTHHLVHDDAIWSFIDAFLERTAVREGVRWCEPRTLFCG